MKKLTVTLLMILMTFASLGYAQTPPPANISLYEQPDTKSKVIGTIAPGTAIIPIFSQGQWLKVGEPTNGQVGWINNESLPAQNQIYVKTLTKTPNTAEGKDYQVIQYSGSQHLDEKQVQELMQNLQKRQVELQQVFDQILNQSVSNFNVLLRQLNQQTSQPWVGPVVQPVIVAPEAKTTTPIGTAQPATAPAATSQPVNAPVPEGGSKNNNGANSAAQN